MPQKYSGYSIDVNQFVDGPDTFISEEQKGWRIYLDESLPTRRDVYVLTSYSWDTNRQDEIQELGVVEIDSNLSREQVDEIFEENEVEKLTDEQWNVLNLAYTRLLQGVIQDGLLDKKFEVYDHTIYSENSDWPRGLEYYLENFEERWEHEKTSEDEKPVWIRDFGCQILPLSEEQMDVLEKIENAVEKPGKEKVPYSEHCQIVGTLRFKDLKGYEYRTLELLHNGVFDGKRAVALVYAMREEGMSQKDIADRLGKSPSTISQQLTTASNLSSRARWHANNVRPVDML